MPEISLKIPQRYLPNHKNFLPSKVLLKKVFPPTCEIRVQFTKNCYLENGGNCHKLGKGVDGNSVKCPDMHTKLHFC